MKSAIETVRDIDYLIELYVSGETVAPSPETVEAVLSHLDLVREHILTDRDPLEARLPCYALYRLHNDCESLRFCGRQRINSRHDPISDAVLMSRLRAFWSDYIQSAIRPAVSV